MVALSNRAANGTMPANTSKIGMRSGRKTHARDEESGPGRPDRCLLRLGGYGGSARDQADAGRPELSDRMGTLARAAALGKAGRGRDQGPREDRGLSVADPHQGGRYVERH